MNTGTIVATYFIVWWLTFFMILPIGVKNASEVGEDVPKGHEAGAPVISRLALKALINCVLAGFATAFIVWVVRSGILAF